MTSLNHILFNLFTMQLKKTRYRVLGWKDLVEIDYSRTVSISPREMTPEVIGLLEKQIQEAIRDMMSGKTFSLPPDHDESRYMII